MLQSTKAAAAAILAADGTLDEITRKAVLAALNAAAAGKPPDTPPRILTRAQVAALFNRGPRTIDLWHRQGILRKIKLTGQSRAVGFRQSDVERLLAETSAAQVSG